MLYISIMKTGNWPWIRIKLKLWYSPSVKCKIIQLFYSDIKSYKLLMIMFNLVSNSTTMDPLIKLLVNRFYKVKRHSMPYWIKFISCAYQLISHWNCLISWCCQFCYMDVKYGVLVILLKLKSCIENILKYYWALQISLPISWFMGKRVLCQLWTMSSQEWKILIWDLWMVKCQSCLSPCTDWWERNVS